MHPQDATVIAEQVTLELLGEAGHEGSLDAELCYDPRDPFAMHIVFATTPAVTWTFGRDLLLAGLYEPAGQGDVQVWPGVTAEGVAAVLLELNSPDGTIVAQLELRDCHSFTLRMITAVPQGEESAYVDLDATLEALLGGSNDLSV